MGGGIPLYVIYTIHFAYIAMFQMKYYTNMHNYLLHLQLSIYHHYPSLCELFALPVQNCNVN